MSQDLINAFQVVSTFLSTIVACLSTTAAVLAIVIATYAEKRNNERFYEQLRREEAIAAANLRPLLDIKLSKFVNYKAVTLLNLGLGTAIVAEISFTKGSQVESTRLIDLFDFSDRFNWDYFRSFKTKPHYIRAGEEKKIVELSESNLLSQGFSQVDSRKILDSLQKQWDGIMITVDYEDILGRKQTSHEVTLTG